MHTVASPVTPKTAEQLVTWDGGNQTNFTFGEWVQAHGWNVQAAVSALNALFEDNVQPYLDQPEIEDECDGVWDGSFTMEDGQPWYVGSDGPHGATGTRKRRVLANDTITLY